MAGDERLAHAVASAEASGDVEAWVAATVGLAEWRAGQGEGGSPLDLWLAVSERLDRLRASYRSRAGRLWAGQVVEQQLQEVVPAALREIGDPGLALSLFEDLRARTLLDEMTQRPRPLPATARDEATSLESKLLGFTPDLADSRIAEEMQLVSQLSVGSDFDRARTLDMVEAIERLYDEHGAGFEGVTPVADAARVQASLRPGELLVELFIPYHRSHPAIELWAAVLTVDGAELIELPLAELTEAALGDASEVIGRMHIDGKPGKDMSPLGILVAEARRALTADSPSTDPAALRALGELVVSPLAGAGVALGDFERMILVPHRVLHPVPWAALLDAQGRHLVECVELGVAPSASVLAELRARPAPGRASYLALGDPALEYAGYSDPLSGAGEEVRQIDDCLRRAGLEGEVLEREEATEAAFARAAPGKSILHISTHAGFPNQTAMDTHSLLLARGGSHDGRLQAHELRAMDLSSAWVSALSVCNGGLYRFGPGDEPYGLVRSLLIAGSRSVMATIWEIDDTAAHQLTVPFFERLAAGDSPTGALAAAERRLAPTWPVRHWASFVLVGACV